MRAWKNLIEKCIRGHKSSSWHMHLKMYLAFDHYYIITALPEMQVYDQCKNIYIIGKSDPSDLSNGMLELWQHVLYSKLSTKWSRSFIKLLNEGSSRTLFLQICDYPSGLRITLV